MNARSFLVVCSLAASMLIPIAGEAGEACGSGPGALYLARFNSPAEAPPYYVSAENGGQARATIWPQAGGCPEPIVEGTFATANGSAIASSDYVAVSGGTGHLCNNSDGTCEQNPPNEPERVVALPIIDDTDDEGAAVESFWFRLTFGSNGLAEPFEAPVHIIDDDGPQRFSLEPKPDGSGAVTYSRSEAFLSVRIPVFRAGPAGAAASIAYQVTDGTAQNGTDYDVAPTGTVSFSTGQRVSTLDIQILRDGEIEGPQTFHITLTGAEAVDPKTTTVTILDIDSDTIRPESKFHHPRNGWTYRRSDYRIREMHVFARDEGPAGVTKVEMAIRKKKRDGSCSWWNDQSRAWQGGPCSQLRWVTMSFLGPYTPTWPNLYEEDFPRLTPSIGTAVRNYTAWSRATDGAGNVEALPFVRGRNWNTFEVKR